MFLCAVVCLQYSTATKTWWDGKLGIWPIQFGELAKQRSHNHEQGTLVWKYISITQAVYRDKVKMKLIPSIIAKWPPGDRATQYICIQQDGAKAHMESDNLEFQAELQAKGLNVVLVTQQGNLPDTNLLDLGFSCGAICK